MKKQVVRFDFWINPVFDQHLKGVADIDLTVCRYSDDEKKTLEVFKNTNVYHICAARDEVPPQWWVNDDLIKKSPNLLCASASGAGDAPVRASRAPQRRSTTQASQYPRHPPNHAPHHR